MDAKEAIKLAKDYTEEMFADEGIYDLGLEEITFNELDKVWIITLGFSRPWDALPEPLAALRGTKGARSYKIIKISDADKKVISISRESY